MLKFSLPVSELPAISTDLFVYLRKIGAKVVGDAYRAIGDEKTPEHIKRHLLAAFEITAAEFNPRLLEFTSVRKAISTKTSSPPDDNAHAIQRARAIRFDALKLEYTILDWMMVLRIETLGDFVDFPPSTLQVFSFPIEFLEAVNKIMADYGLPNKEVDGLPKKKPIRSR